MISWDVQTVDEHVGGEVKKTGIHSPFRQTHTHMVHMVRGVGGSGVDPSDQNMRQAIDIIETPTRTHTLAEKAF